MMLELPGFAEGTAVPMSVRNWTASSPKDHKLRN